MKRTIIGKMKEQIVDMQKRLDNNRILTAEAQAKVEVYKEQEESREKSSIYRREGLEDQVLWLRNLVENLTTSPDKIVAKAKAESERIAAEITLHRKGCGGCPACADSPRRPY